MVWFLSVDSTKMKSQSKFAINMPDVNTKHSQSHKTIFTDRRRKVSAKCSKSWIQCVERIICVSTNIHGITEVVEREHTMKKY